MALRRYTDPIGQEWKVWDIPPRFSPKRSGFDRRAAEEPRHWPERRTVGDRRVTPPLPEWVHGWICFQNESEKYRLCPLPDDWEQVSNEELEGYRRRATFAGKAI